MMKMMEDSELDLVNIMVEEGERDTYIPIYWAREDPHSLTGQ